MITTCVPHFIQLLPLKSFFFFSLQLEKIIGKLKAEKYGQQILNEIINYESNDQIDDSSGGGREDSTGPAVKKLKTKKAVVVLESSEDET